MIQQLFIDGQLADINENTNVTFSIVSNLLTGAAEFKGNRSFTITLPFTVHNMRIIEQAQVVQVDSGFPYTFHGVEFIRDGIPIIQDGLGRLVSVTHDEISIAVTWGVRTAVDVLLAGDDKLSDLETPAYIEFHKDPQVTTYSDALIDDVFYAALDTELHGSVNDYYHTRVLMGGEKFDYTEVFSASSYLHPSVRVTWILGLLESKYGASVDWGDAMDDIGTLIVPLVSKIPNGTTYNNGFTATASDPQTTGGLNGNFIRFSVTRDSAIIAETTSSPASTQLTCATAFKGLIRYQFVMYINEADLVRVSWPVVRARYGYSLGLKVGSTWHWCQILPEGMTFLATEKIVSGKLTLYVTGWLNVEMAVGDTIAVRIAPISNGVTNPEIAADIHIQGGPIYVSEIVGKENEVQPGQLFPVEGNLPDIKPLDLIKFLAAVTGTFPVQASTSDTLVMRPVSALFDWDNAVDWSSRVFDMDNLPTARQNEFAVNGWAQHNWWRWKEDDTVAGDYDGSIDVDDDTLEQNREIFTFPFAASDNNNVPLYTTEVRNGVPETKYKKTQPRVMRLISGEGDEAVGFFDMDMKRIVQEKYGHLAESLSRPVIVTENIRMNDVELANFDESRAVYLRQHSAYFAVLEMAVKGNGTAEVKLLKLKKQQEEI